MTDKSLRLAIASVLALVALLVLMFGLHAVQAESNRMQVSFINVGQGDGILVRVPGDFDVLVDGGKSFAGPTVVAYLRQQGVDDIDVMVASHSHSDHIGGLVDVLEVSDIPVQTALYNGYPGSSQAWSTFATAVANEGLELQSIQYPMTDTWGLATVYYLNPPPGMINPEENNTSVVVLLVYGEQRFLLTGDIEAPVEAEVIVRGTPVAADMLKVPHHGSDTSSSLPFLQAVQPTDAVISVGPNSYGHPDPAVLERLQALGIQNWLTSRNGTIVVESDGASYTLTAQFTDFVFMPMVYR